MKSKQFVIQLSTGLLLTGAVAWLLGAFSLTEAKDIILKLGDSFTATGVFFLCVSGLMLVSTTGFFDIFSYAARKGMHCILPGTFYEYEGGFIQYRDEKEEARKEKKRTTMFLPGAIFLVIAIILIIIWYNI